MAQTITFGKLAFNSRGEYDSAEVYGKLDVVTYNNAVWLCQIDNTNTAPTEGEKWHKLVSGVDFPSGNEGDVFQYKYGQATFAPMPPSELKVAKASLSASYRRFGAILNNGSIRIGGRSGNYGLAGGNSDSQFAKIVNLPAGEIAVDIYHMCESSFVLTQSGNVYSWGYNGYGNLGLGHTANVAVPTKVAIPEPVATLIVPLEDDSDQGAVFALTKSGNVYSWGYNSYGQLGVGDTTNRTAPVKISALNNIVKVIPYSGRFNISAGAIDASGNLYTWGYNGHGQLGLGDTTNRTAPIKVTSITAKDAYFVGGGWYSNGWYNGSSLFVIDTNNKLYSCGFNGWGQLGLGDTTNRTALTAITIGCTPTKITGVGYAGAVAVLSNTGTVYTCGYNGFGTLGLGDTNQRSAFIQTSLSNIVDVLVSGDNNALKTCALDSSGNVYVAGYNGNYNLGTGDTTQRNSFVKLQIGEPVTQILHNGVQSENCFVLITQSGKMLVTGCIGSYQQQQSSINQFAQITWN